MQCLGGFWQQGGVRALAGSSKVSLHFQARVGARKFQKVILTVSPRGISLQDADTKEMVENISIYRWAWRAGGPG